MTFSRYNFMSKMSILLFFFFCYEKCLPIRDLEEQKQFPVYKKLQDRVDMFENHLSAAEILFK